MRLKLTAEHHGKGIQCTEGPTGTRKKSKEEGNRKRKGEGEDEEIFYKNKKRGNIKVAIKRTC